MGWVLLGFHLLLLFLLLKQVTVLVLAIWTWQFSDVPYEPTPSKTVKKLITKLNIQAGQKIYDLGSGGGEVAIHLALLTPSQVIALEKNLILHLTAQFKWFLIKKARGSLELKRQDFFTANLSKADYLYLYAVPKTIKKLIPKMVQELQSNTILISWRFPVNNPQFKLIDQFQQRHTMYFYQKVE